MHITFVIPIHNQIKLLQRCVESIFICTPPMKYSIVFIDDGSTDPKVEAFCQRLVRYIKDMQITYLHNDTPRGFSAACNQGMLVGGMGDYYAIINTDTEIGTWDWTQSLKTLSESNPDIGLFGPVSNNAGSQSLPVLQGGSLLPGESIPSFSKLVREHTKHIYPPISLIHGFCYIVRKEVIEDVGNFNADAFPHYGAEDDLSIRAVQAGWKGVILDDVFVYHIGAASYDNSNRDELAGRATQQLMEIYGEDYVNTLHAQGDVGLGYMRESMGGHYRVKFNMPRRVQ